MSYDSTRKTFLAKLAGLATVVGLAPRLLAQSVSRPSGSEPAPGEPRVFAINPDTRAVARRADSV